MQSIASGQLQKLVTALDSPVSYQMPIGDQLVPLNGLIGKAIKLEYHGRITCLNCGRNSKKSFNQGYCYPCFRKLARCDNCIVSPEKCHYHEGTCREPEWADEFCMKDHFVYLANSSGVKVGITRGNQIPTRWMDQGAIQALPIFRVKNRQLSGLVEVAFKAFVADKTNWRTMLKGEVEPLDLAMRRDELLEQVSEDVAALQREHGLQAVQVIENGEQVNIDYPVIEYPVKVSSFNLDKNPVVEGALQGIKGQYLILDKGVINIRKYAAYHIEFCAD